GSQIHSVGQPALSRQTSASMSANDDSRTAHDRPISDMHSSESSFAWNTLCNPHVPENRRSELEDSSDVLSEGRRLNPFSPRAVGTFAEGNFLDLAGELLAFGFIGRAHPIGDELLELRDVRPAEPGAWARARHAEVDGGIDHVRRHPPRVQQVPAALVG